MTAQGYRSRYRQLYNVGSVGSLLSGATADDTSHGEQHGKYDEGVQTITQRNTYHQLATPAYRRNSEQLDTSPCEMTISGPGWNANWRSVQSGKSLSRKHKYTGDQVVAQSADDALRILLGENAKIVPRKRSSATLQTDEKVKGQSAGSFSVRASHNPSAMDDHISKSHMDNDKNQTTTMSHEFRSRSKLGQESSKSYDKDIGSTDKSPNGDALKSHSSGEVPNQTVHDEDTSGGIETKYDAMPSHNNLPQNTRHHMETNMLNKIVVMNKLDLEPLVETSADDTMNMAPRPVNGEVRLRSRSVPGPVDLGFSVREDPSIMSREEALNHIAQAKAARAGQATEVRSPDTRSPLNVGYPNLTAELIRAKLRQKQENTLNRMANESVRVQYKDTPSTGPIVVETAPDLAPYLFARSTQNEISPDDTLRRLEMLKRRRRCLSTDAASMDDVADDEPEEHIDVSEMYAKTEERVLMDLQKMKVKQQKQQEEISARLARRLNATVSTSGERFDFSSRGVESLDDNDGGRANGDQVESTKPQDENQEISNEYLRSQNIERTAETLDWYRHKRQTAESMCNAKLNRLLSGIDQRYAQFQEDQVGRYISPSSHMAAAVLSGGRTSRPSSRFTSYARRTQSSERIRRYDRDEDEGTRSRFYAGNPFDV